jgi:hypothetical protein
VWKREADDHYAEPAWVTERLLDVEHFPGAIHDPAAGFGTVPHVANQRGLTATAADIVDRRGPFGELDGFTLQNFLTDDSLRDNVITNPPLHIVEAFTMHALAVAKHKVAVVFPTGRLNAALHSWLKGTPLARVWFLSPRPSMPPGYIITAGGTPGGGKTDYCWLVFDHGHSGFSEMRSLHRDK